MHAPRPGFTGVFIKFRYIFYYVRRSAIIAMLSSGKYISNINPFILKKKSPDLPASNAVPASIFYDLYGPIGMILVPPSF